jgi:hypothetical protein
MTEQTDQKYGQEHISSLINEKNIDRYKVSTGQHFAGWMNEHCRPFLKMLSKLEDLTWDEQLDAIHIKSPVYVCGLARSGTTILLELLYGTGGFATHIYKDYPYLDVPILWNKWQNLSSSSAPAEVERAHLDGIMITPDSPEAFEEMLWRRFFPECHVPSQTNVFDQNDNHPEFEIYYKTHLKKILLQRQAERYLAKGNYNLTRIAYLHKLFPDAKFVIPIRSPSTHIFSLMKQHSLFNAMEDVDPRAAKYMRWSGHYEFGHNRVPINIGDHEKISSIQNAWGSGDDVKGWALYWDMLHRWLYNTLADNPSLQACVQLVDYDLLCAEPKTQLARVFDHCDVLTDDDVFKALSSRIKSPTYYKPSFDQSDEALIKDITEGAHKDLLSMS